jgi:iron complex transport system ATP-binding protein
VTAGDPLVAVGDRPALVASRPPIVELRDVTAGYRSRPVLEEISIAIAPAERVAVVGPNGAGKSSLLRVMSGILKPSRGTALLAGDSIDRLDRRTVARRLAVVPQASMLPFATRVEELVGLGRIPHEDPFRGHRPVDRAAIAAAIDRVGVGHLLGRDARELSLGERQLVLIALAVAQAAPLILLDEPTVHLDIRHQVQVMELLVDLNERDGTTVVAVVHDLRFAAHFFGRTVVVDRARIVADDVPDRALEPDRVRDVFGVDPGLVRLALGAAD